MHWYVAHAIMYVEFKDGTQDLYPVWENFLLIEAENEDEAFEKAVTRAKEDEGDNDGTFAWTDRPATWVFAGIRKLIKVSHSGAEGHLSHGDELSYSELSVADKASLEKLVRGEELLIEYLY